MRFDAVRVSAYLTAVTIDTSAQESIPTPTVSIQDVDKASRAEGQAVGAVSIQQSDGDIVTHEMQDSIPGAIPAGAAPPVPTWVRTNPTGLWLMI